MPTFLLAPMGVDAGLTSVALGLVRALAQNGLKVGFLKPITTDAQPDTERSTHFARQLCQLRTPTPLTMAHAETQLSQGHVDALLEDVVGLHQQVARDADVVIVEGLVPDTHHLFAIDLNHQLAHALQCQVMLVGNAHEQAPPALAAQIDLHTQGFGNGLVHVLGYILNRVAAETDPQTLATDIASATPQAERPPCLGAIPLRAALMAPRTLDVARHLNARLLNEGQAATRRVLDIEVVARALPHSLSLLQPGSLLITPGDRDDTIFAAAMATLSGVPLAGVLLTDGTAPDARTTQLCQKAWAAGLPVLQVDTNTRDTTHQLATMGHHVPTDDLARMAQVLDHVASHLDITPLTQHLGQAHEHHLSPPAFRYQLMQRARQAAKCIVLPEGDEPRTLHAAAICHDKGIAHCVLLGDPATILQAAAAQGITLPPDVRLVNPAEVRARYVAPMVALRQGKGLSASMAEQQLEDNVVLGTMMLALGEVDGLVSGAVHTTANTILPALQLIKTAPGTRLVSSVFFMLMPDQVFVYGDCAVNPDPTAEELADIAIQSADSALAFGIPPRVAMISYATGNSGTGSDVDKVREATRIARSKRPDLLIDGPMQYDAASVESVGRQKAPDSPVAGHANVFVFPDLNTGNTTYKAVQRSAGVVSVGPMLQGLRKPVNDLSRGALVDDIVYTIALTAIQADQ